MKLKHLNKIIDESTFYKGRLNLPRNHNDILILEDPSFNALRGLFNQGDVRGLYTPDNEKFYFWNAESLNHYSFYQEFGFGDDDGDLGFILAKDEIKFPQWMVNPEKFGIKDKDKLWDIKCDMEIVTNDNVIKSLYPNGFKIGVSY